MLFASSFASITSIFASRLASSSILDLFSLSFILSFSICFLRSVSSRFILAASSASFLAFARFCSRSVITSSNFISSSDNISFALSIILSSSPSLREIANAFDLPGTPIRSL